jgi:hypothetical protein
VRQVEFGYSSRRIIKISPSAADYGENKPVELGKFLKLSDESCQQKIMITSAAVAYVFPYKFLVGPGLIILLSLSLMVLVRKPALKGNIGNSLVLVGTSEGIGCLWLNFLEGFVIGLGTLFIGLLLAFDAWRPPKAALLSRQKRFPPKNVAAVVLLVAGAVSICVGLYLASFMVVVSAFAVLAVGGGLGFNSLVIWISRQQRLKNSPKLRKAAYLGLSIIVLISGLLISLRATNVLHEQRLENWTGTVVNLTVQGLISDVRFNYEVNNGYNYHIFLEYITLSVTKVLWVNSEGENLTNTAYSLSNQTLVVCCDKPKTPTLNTGESVEVNGYYDGSLGNSVYSGKLIVSPSMNESYIELSQST